MMVMCRHSSAEQPSGVLFPWWAVVTTKMALNHRPCCGRLLRFHCSCDLLATANLRTLQDQLPDSMCLIIGVHLVFIPPASTKLKWGYTGITLSVCPSVDRIVSALYLQQYSSDPFHICTSYQATSEGVSRIMPVAKFEILANFLNL